MSKYAQLFNSTPTLNQDSFDSVAQRYTILLVDDEPNVLAALQRIFIDESYRILTASNGQDALNILVQQEVQLIISDHRMPGITGTQLLREIKQKWPETIRIMLTGYADVQSVMGAVKDGAVYKFITKPWNDEDLRLTVSLGLQQHALLKENRSLKKLSAAQQEKIRSAAPIFSHGNSAFGTILIGAKLITTADIEWALKEQNPHEFLGTTMVRLNITNEGEIFSTLKQRLKIDSIDLKEAQIQPAVARCLPHDFCSQNHLVPVKLEDDRLTIAMADPSDLTKCDNLAIITGLKIVTILAENSAIDQTLDRCFGEVKGLRDEELQDLLDLEPIDEIDIVIDSEDDIEIDALLRQADVPPIIRIVNAVIAEAIRYGASDIHIEPKTKYTVVRYRIDGILQDKIKIPSDLHAATISRIKILAKMDISERRRPQDGRVTIKLGIKIVDMRISTMPVINGEKIVMRILDKSAAVKKLQELGVPEADMLRMKSLTQRPQGVIISTGPTGSGKTTLLYSLLSSMMTSTKNFETIEEPVEYFLEEANQVSVVGKIGLSFGQVLRATLRQDPDVILVGEIRDAETADISFKAALTGHMVLSSLHSNSAISSITRLIDIGVKPYIIASALEAIVAQRLVRRICPNCRHQITPDIEQLKLLDLTTVDLPQAFIGTGCDQCHNSGYKGRVGIFELFVMNEEFRHFITTEYRESTLLGMARDGGMKLLIEDGVAKAAAGETTIEELIRIIGPQLRYERVCSGCGRTIAAKHRFCPHCGQAKQSTCPKCHTPLEQGWNNCPNCKTPIET